MKRLLLIFMFLPFIGFGQSGNFGEKTGCVSGDCVNGYGTHISSNGSKYVGEWKNDQRHGQGTYTYADGTIKKGLWGDGEFIREDSGQIDDDISFNTNLLLGIWKLQYEWDCIASQAGGFEIEHYSNGEAIRINEYGTTAADWQLHGQEYTLKIYYSGTTDPVVYTGIYKNGVIKGTMINSSERTGCFTVERKGVYQKPAIEACNRKSKLAIAD